MNQYQKVYMNQIHSSSLLGQLAQMWRSQMLCDALIRTGNVTTKAHRVVLVAACPMLQSMDNASVGSHLEVRLAADIKQEAVNSFLQYLYEGFMMLTEENCKDVEKVARLLQVDSVTKCCIDFYNCLQKKTGVPVYSNTQYKYSSADLLEFRHVRTTDLQKTIHERMMKRAAADSMRPTSPGGKRQRMQQQQRPMSPNIDLAMFGQKADDTLSMAHSYMGNMGNQAAADPWERVPRIGAAHRPQPKPGVIEIVEDSLEILQTQPPDKDGNKSAPPIIQKSLAISVSSQMNPSTDVHVVNVSDSASHPTIANDAPVLSTGRDSITVSPLTVMPGSASTSTSSPLTKDPNKSFDNQREAPDKAPYIKKSSQPLDHQSSTPQRLFPVSLSPANMSPISQISQHKKSFAAGSASQAAGMSQSQDSPTISKRSSSSVSEMGDRPPSSESGKDIGAKSKVDDGSASNSTDMAPDLSIVKIEPTSGDPGLDMYVDVPDDSMMQAAQQREQREHDDESDLELEDASGDWSRDEMSNEAGGGDQNNSWYIGQFKGVEHVETEDEEPQFGFEVYSLTGSAYDEFYNSNHHTDSTQSPGVPVLSADTSCQLETSVVNGEMFVTMSPAKMKNKPSPALNKFISPVKGATSKSNKTSCTTKKNKTAKKVNYNSKNKARVSRKSKTDCSSVKRKKTDKLTNLHLKTGRLKYALRKAEGRASRSRTQITQSVQTDIEEKTISRRNDNSDKKSFSSIRKRPSIVGKLIPSKDVAGLPKKMENKLETSKISIATRKITNKTGPDNSTEIALRRTSDLPFQVADPNFWNIPLEALLDIDKMPENLTLQSSSGISVCVLPNTDCLVIKEPIIEAALKKSSNVSFRFAMSLFRSIFSVSEVYDKIISGHSNKENISPLKIKLIRKQTFKHFPAKHGLEEFQWKHILYGFNVNVGKVHDVIRKWFDISAIMDQL